MTAKQLPIKFTVVVPTRERSDTLLSTLKTCVMQNYDALDILVSDNFSQDQTRSVVESFKDPRIRYINTGARMSMSHNWEFALSHVKDSYVMFLGDDDGLLPDAISDLNRVISETGAKAVNWMPVSYGWPNCSYPWIRNKLKVAVGQGIEWRYSRDYLSKILAFTHGYADLPMMYGFFVSLDTINAARGKDGKFFYSMTPDIYSGIAVAGVLDRYVYSLRPYAIFGISSHSTGASFFNSKVDNRSASHFLREENIPFHEKFVMASSMAILTGESFFQAQDALAALRDVRFDFRRMVGASLKESSRVPAPVRDKVIEALVQISEKNNLGPDVVRRIKKYKPKFRDKLIPRSVWRNILYKIVFDGEKHGLKNVYDASLFCRDVIERRKTGELFVKERGEIILDQAARGIDIFMNRAKEKWGY